jgi:hypothetical protein
MARRDEYELKIDPVGYKGISDNRRERATAKKLAGQRHLAVRPDAASLQFWQL